MATAVLPANGTGVSTRWNTHLGPQTATVEMAVGGSLDQWTLAAGASKVAAINSPNDDDTSYITGAEGQRQDFTPGSLAAVPDDAEITSVSVNMRAARDGGSNGTVRANHILDATTVNGTTRVAEASYSNFTDTYTAKPGGGTWTKADIAALIVQLENVTGDANVVRVTTLTLTVTWSGTSAQKVAAVAAPDDDDTTYVAPTGTNQRQSFTFDASSVPVGSTIDAVSIRWRGFTAGSSTMRADARLGNDLEPGTGNGQTLSNVWQTFTEARDRPGGGVWSLEDLDEVEADFIMTAVFNPGRVTTAELVVDYTAPPAPSRRRYRPSRRPLARRYRSG
ncbi:MAG: hypothetical protein KIS87_08885 [Phycisphaeraceae bacterium]|nr:hypothetical protein [Phycisphaeraceae bacterium]